MRTSFFTSVFIFLGISLTVTSCVHLDPYSQEEEQITIENSRSNPLGYIESERRHSDEKRNKVKSLGLGIHELDKCADLKLGDFKFDSPCKKEYLVKLELKCNTNQGQNSFDVLVPLRYRDIEIDIADKKFEVNNGFPLKLQSGPNGELSFAISPESNSDFKFILRRNLREII